MQPKRALLTSVIFALIILFTPWESFKENAFFDKSNYLEYALYGTNALEFRSFDSVFSYISQEWLWHFIILNIKDYMPYEIFFNGVSFISLLSIAYYMLRRNSLLSILLLINPLIINLVMSQYRISFAMSIVLTAIIFKKNKIIRNLLVAAACLIHTSTVLFVFSYILIVFLNKKLIRRPYLYNFCLIMIGMSISLMLSGFVDVILEAIGDRRTDYAIDDLSSSLSYLSFWIISFILVVINYLNRRFEYLYESVALVVLSNIAFNAIFGGYSTRVLAVFFPVIMSTLLHLKPSYRIPLIFLFFLYSVLQWYFWFNY